MFAPVPTPAERALAQKMQEAMLALRDPAAVELEAQQAELRGAAEDIQAALVTISDRYRTVIANLRKSDILTLSPEQTGGIAQVGGLCDAVAVWVWCRSCVGVACLCGGVSVWWRSCV